MALQDSNYLREMPLPGQDVLIISKPGVFVENFVSYMFGYHLNYKAEITSKYQHYRFYFHPKVSDVVVVDSALFNEKETSQGAEFHASFFRLFHVLIWIEDFDSLPYIYRSNARFWKRPSEICEAVIVNYPIYISYTRGLDLPGRSVPCKIFLLAQYRRQIFRSFAFLVNRRIEITFT